MFVLNEITYVMHQAQCLAFTKNPVNLVRPLGDVSRRQQLSVLFQVLFPDIPENDPTSLATYHLSVHSSSNLPLQILLILLCRNLSEWALQSPSICYTYSNSCVFENPLSLFLSLTFTLPLELRRLSSHIQLSPLFQFMVIFTSGAPKILTTSLTNEALLWLYL